MDDIDIILAGQPETGLLHRNRHPTAAPARTAPARPAVAPAPCIRSREDLDAMTVHQLRAIAREIPGLGIQGQTDLEGEQAGPHPRDPQGPERLTGSGIRARAVPPVSSRARMA